MWYEKLIEGLTGRAIINDSKTPSGRVHVGSLRGVLIHDALYRALRDRGTEVVYLYGIDDYDPLDGLPADAAPSLQAYMGYPLCNIPPPPGSNASDLADHYISEFLAIFPELGVGAEIYRMRDMYRSGRFNEAIDAILKRSDTVRRIYAEVSHAARPDDWHPFQVICENCGRIGTTEVVAYDGSEVGYRCRTDLVAWARGCGHSGKLSPFDGNGKLPWKLEWAAKWHTFGITLEGAGKDHCTRGGSRDVAAHCYEAIFGAPPPVNVPYEFFLVSGAKMSSSRGVGTAAREIANFLPPEILRFLMIRTPPKRTVNFSTDFEYIVKLFNEHDRLVESASSDPSRDSERKLLQTIEADRRSTAYHPVGFQLLIALLQLPHIDVEAEIAARSEQGLSALDREILRRRLSAAKYWLENYACEHDRMVLQASLPASAASLSASQRAFLQLLGEHFPSGRLGEEAYQKLIFDTARMTPIDQKSAFAALYRVLLDKAHGPKGGALLAYLDREFLVRRFSEIGFSRAAFWKESGVSRNACEAWFERHRGEIAGASARFLVNVVVPSGGSKDDQRYPTGTGVIEITVVMADEKVHTVRVLLNEFAGGGMDSAAAAERLEAHGRRFLADLAREAGIAIAPIDGPVIDRETV